MKFDQLPVWVVTVTCMSAMWVLGPLFLVFCLWLKSLFGSAAPLVLLFSLGCLGFTVVAVWALRRRSDTQKGRT